MHLSGLDFLAMSVPLAAVLFASAALQVPVPEPERVYAAASLWLLAFVLLLVYVVTGVVVPAA